MGNCYVKFMYQQPIDKKIDDKIKKDIKKITYNMNLNHYLKINKIQNNDNDDFTNIIEYKIKVPELYYFIYDEDENKQLLNNCIKKIFIVLKYHNITTEIDLYN